MILSILKKVIVYEWRVYMQREENREGSTRQLPDGAWECITQAKYLNPKTCTPKRFKRKAATEKEARNAAKMARDAWEKEYEKGRDTKVNKTKTFGQYMEEYIETCVKPNLTGSGYHSYISNMKCNFYPFAIAKFQLHMLNAEAFQKYYEEILTLKSEKTCSLPRQLCVRCCKWLVDKRLLPENYATQVVINRKIVDEYVKEQDERIKKQKKIFSYEDIEKFYYAYKNNMGQYPVVVLFLLETGLRAGEFAALRNSNIDLERNRIDIVETSAIRFKNNDKSKGIEVYTKVPKNKESRFVMMSDLCRECVLYMQEQTKLYCKNNPDDLLYPTFSNGKKRTSSSMEVCFKELCNKLEIDRDVQLTKKGQTKGLCLHALRHTADTIANTQKGANVVNTALMMGHKAITVENVYTHATEEALKTVTTPSQAVLKEYRNDIIKDDKEKELYEMYLKLKDKFEK